MTRYLWLPIVLGLSGAGVAWSQDFSPDPALAAEAAGRWEEALVLHRTALARDPLRADLWVRVADIASHLDRPTEALDALRAATGARPDDAALHARLAQAY
jgi:predicted Zn-dependent protease